MSRTNRLALRGFTLVELLIAMALMTILIGTASFIFVQTQKIWSRVDKRMQIAQAWRGTSWQLESDLARFERVNAKSDPIVCMNTAPGPDAAPLPNAIAKRYDMITLVTHNIDNNDTDRYCQITYTKGNNQLATPATTGIWRFRRWLKVDGTGKLVADGGWEWSEVFPYATGFKVRWFHKSGDANYHGTFLDPISASAPGPAGIDRTDNGDQFYKDLRSPTGIFDTSMIEVSVYVVENPGKADTGSMTLSKIFNVPSN